MFPVVNMFTISKTDRERLLYPIMAFCMGILVALILVMLTMPGVVFADDPEDLTLYEYLNTGDDGDDQIYAQKWSAQTFTTGSTPHTVKEIGLKLFNSGDPGTVTVSIQKANGSEHPNNIDLFTETVDGNYISSEAGGTWYRVSLTTEYSLEASTQYAIVVRALEGDATNYIEWRVDTGDGEANGAKELSTDGGIAWSTTAGSDYLFEIWGYPVLEAYEAKVFSSFVEEDDWLITVHYKNVYPPYSPSETPEEYFDIQLIDGSTVIAQVKMSAWGNKPGAIYINADAVEALEWGSSYDVAITGTDAMFGSPPSEDYTLQGADWLGDDPFWLDSWVIEIAGEVQNYYGVALLSYAAEGYVLNDLGSAIFREGIPGLGAERPGLFERIGSEVDTEVEEHDDTYSQSLIGNFGTDAITAFNNLGTFLGCGGTFLMGFLWAFLTALVCSLGYLGTKSPIVALVLGLPVLFAGGYLGVIPLVFIVTGTLIAFAYMIYSIWLRGT